MYLRVSLFALLVSNGQGQPETGKEWSAAEIGAAAVDSSAVVAACEKMSDVEYCAYVERLGKGKDFASLAAIYQSSLYNHEYAAYVAAEDMPHDKAVAFCSKLELLSPNWRAAFRALESHPKAAVIGYVKRLGASANPYVRVHCYELCRRAGWDDLLEQAKRDVNSEKPICFDGVINAFNPVGGRPETIGTHAQGYVEDIEQKRKDDKKSDR